VDYIRSPPFSISKPFIETIDEWDLLNLTALLFLLSCFFFQEVATCNTLIHSEKFSICICMVSDIYIYIYYLTRQPTDFFLFTHIYFLLRQVNEKIITRTLIIALRRMIDHALRRVSWKLLGTSYSLFSACEFVKLDSRRASGELGMVNLLERRLTNSSKIYLLGIIVEITVVSVIIFIIIIFISSQIAANGIITRSNYGSVNS